MAEMVVPPGPRKRRSTVALRDDEESRKQLPEEDAKRSSTTDATRKKTNPVLARMKLERKEKCKQEIDSGRWVEKKIRKVARRWCCVCRNQVVFRKVDCSCTVCEHERCVQCLGAC